jgi:hypothetical protein
MSHQNGATSAHSHYLFVSKANQPDLVAEVALLFDQPPPGERFPTAVSRCTQRGRSELRTLTSGAALGGYLREWGWVGAQQVLRLESVVRRQAKTTQMVRSFVTSLGPQIAPNALLRLAREHWHMENRWH